MMRRRDRQSEIIVALVVTVMMAFALAFGILLSLGNDSDEDNDTATESVDATQRTSTVEIAGVSDQTEAAETLEISEPATETTDDTTPAIVVETEEVIVTENTPTVTEITPSQEPTTAIATEELETEEAAIAETEITPATSTPSNTPTKTATPSPTFTNTATLTNTPTRTSSPTATFTSTPTRQILFPITFTPTRTATHTPSASPTLTPTLTTVPLITVVVPTGTAPPTMACVQPTDWDVYIIQAGDTFFSIARTFNISREELAVANCLTNTNVIYAGQPLLVPPSVFSPTDAAVQKCDNPNVQITAPLPGQGLDGIVTLQGIATGENFRRYIIDWRPDTPTVTFKSFAEVFEAKPQPSDLATFNTDAFEPGLYWFNLFALDANDNLIGDCAIRVRFN